MCRNVSFETQTANPHLSYGDGEEWLFFSFLEGGGVRWGGTIFHEFNTRGHSGSDMGSSPAMEQRALCPRLNEQ